MQALGATRVAKRRLAGRAHAPTRPGGPHRLLTARRGAAGPQALPGAWCWAPGPCTRWLAQAPPSPLLAQHIKWIAQAGVGPTQHAAPVAPLATPLAPSALPRLGVHPGNLRAYTAPTPSHPAGLRLLTPHSARPPPPRAVVPRKNCKWDGTVTAHAQRTQEYRTPWTQWPRRPAPPPPPTQSFTRPMGPHHPASPAAQTGKGMR